MTIGGDRPPRLGDVTFEDIREFLVAYSGYEQQMHITNQDGGDRVLARRRELVDSATQMMVADELYDMASPGSASPRRSYCKGLKGLLALICSRRVMRIFAARYSDLLKMDASVPVDSRVFMQKRAPPKYVAHNGLTEVLRPGGRRCTLKRCKVLVEAIAAGIEPLDFRRKVEKKMRFDLVTLDSEALFSIIAKQQRDQAAIEANDAVRRQKAKRRDARSVAVEGTKPQGSTADDHDSHEKAKAAGVKAEQGRRYDNNECFVCDKHGHQQWDCLQSQCGKAGKGVHGQTHGQTPVQQQQSPSDPTQHSRSKATGMAPATDTRRSSAYKTASQAVVTEIEPASPEPSRRNDDDYVHIRVPRERMAPVDYGLAETVQHQVSQSAGPQNAASVLHSVPVQLPAPPSQQSCDDTITILYARLSVSQPGGSGDTSVDTV